MINKGLTSLKTTNHLASSTLESKIIQSSSQSQDNYEKYVV